MILKKIPINDDRQLTRNEIDCIEYQLINLTNDILPENEQISKIKELLDLKTSKIDIPIHQQEQLKHIQYIVEILESGGKIENENLAKELNIMLSDAKSDHSRIDQYNEIQNEIENIDEIMIQIPGKKSMTQREKELVRGELEQMLKIVDDENIKKKLREAEIFLDKSDYPNFWKLLNEAKSDLEKKTKIMTTDDVKKEANKYNDMSKRLREISEVITRALQNNEAVLNTTIVSINKDLEKFWCKLLDENCNDPRFKNKKPEDVRVSELPVNKMEKKMLQEIKDLETFMIKILRDNSKKMDSKDLEKKKRIIGKNTI